MIIKFLEKLMPKKSNVFYEQFNEEAQNCLDMAHLFKKAINEGATKELIMEARIKKRKGNSLEHDIITMLNATVITPIEREDIQLLAILINKISKKIERACKHLNLYQVKVVTEDLKEQSDLILQACEQLVSIVSMLSDIQKTKEITYERDAIKSIETMGDDLTYRAVANLFNGEFDALEIMKLRDILRDGESALDKCFSVADEILNIALKNN